MAIRLIALIAFASLALGAATTSAQTTSEASPCPSSWEEVDGHDGERLCWHPNLPRALTIARAHEFLAEGFSPSDFQPHPANPTQEEIDSLESGDSYSYIVCGPGERLLATPEFGGTDTVNGCAQSDLSLILDWTNFDWASNHCGPGQRIGYTNGGNGSPICASDHEFVDCASGNSEGLSGRRCIRSFEEIYGQAYETPPNDPTLRDSSLDSGTRISKRVARDTNGQILRDEAGQALTEDIPEGDDNSYGTGRCAGLVWIEEVGQWVCNY